MMTHNGNDVITPTAQAATPAVTFPSLCSEAALPFFSPFFVLGVVKLVVVMFKCLNRFTWRRYAFSRVPSSFSRLIVEADADKS